MGDARDDWKVVRALSEVLGAPLPYNSLDDVRRRLADVAPHFGRRDAVEAPLWLNGEYFKVGGCGSTPRGGWGVGGEGAWVLWRAAGRGAASWRCAAPRSAAAPQRLPLTPCTPSPAHCAPCPRHPQAFADRAKKEAPSAEPLASSVAQFYQTDAISRASKVMAKCIKVGGWG